MLSPTIKGKTRRREGDAAGEGKRFRRSRFVFHRKRRRPRMAYGASYLKGTRFFDRRGMIAGPSPRSARWPIGIAAFGLCLPPARPGKALATTERKGSMQLLRPPPS
nr:hypothetical protein [Ipomoea trifida]GLL21574.1 hypothetical protein [Ipomoea trifida]GMD20655.1 nadh-ubiquinone oxidoreductase chain 2 [Ipomoea batatas]GME10003.1 nadh-ubiquinone oxidoreductase chain 2 [Ipomoea batatas]